MFKCLIFTQDYLQKNVDVRRGMLVKMEQHQTVTLQLVSEEGEGIINLRYDRKKIKLKVCSQVKQARKGHNRGQVCAEIMYKKEKPQKETIIFCLCRATLKNKLPI